jgi:hypothetical protein
MTGLADDDAKRGSARPGRAFLSRPALVAECAIAGVPGLRPHPVQSLAGIGEVILDGIGDEVLPAETLLAELLEPGVLVGE